MISFTVPVTSYFPSGETFNVDRNPSFDKQIRFLRARSNTSLEQTRADGINVVETKFSFRLVNLVMNDALGLDDYFNSLKGTGKVVITLPDSSTVNVIIPSWDIGVDSALFASINVNAEITRL
jgi:hypothetical protein